jgi:NAD-dependent DNA ligase
LGGVRIEYATGFNGAFIEQNKVGIGALIELIRSGDVIPHIKSVVEPAEEAKMPDIPYKWNDTHVDVMLEDAGSNETVKEKNITGFFRGLEVEGLSSGNVSRIIKAGHDSVPAILQMTLSDFLKVDGFKQKMATKLYEGIQEKVGAASLVTIMSASNIFGRGFNDKRIDPILDAEPDILTSTDAPEVKVEKLRKIKGIERKTAEAFVSKIPDFMKFLHDAHLDNKLSSAVASLEKVAVNEANPLFKKTVVMTGIRDKTVIEALKTVGAKLGSSVSGNTLVVIAKSKDEDTGKAEEAKQKGIPIMTPDEFMQTYFG